MKACEGGRGWVGVLLAASTSSSTVVVMYWAVLCRSSFTSSITWVIMVADELFRLITSRNSFMQVLRSITWSSRAAGLVVKCMLEVSITGGLVICCMGGGGVGMREPISITINLMASAAGAVMPGVVKVKCSNMVLSDKWLGSKLGRRRKWSWRYFVVVAGEAIADENAGELSISSFVHPVARDPYVEVCLLVEMLPLT